jgi:hypothetical protein
MTDAPEYDEKLIAREHQQPQQQPENKEQKEKSDSSKKRVIALDDATRKKLGILTGSPNKLYSGKAVLWRDVGIPVAVVAICIMLAFTAPTFGKNPPRKDLDSLEAIGDFLKNRAQKKYQKRGGKSAANCTLFLAPSSIPGAGRSLFAGREYAVGDIVVRF